MASAADNFLNTLIAKLGPQNAALFDQACAQRQQALQGGQAYPGYTPAMLPGGPPPNGGTYPPNGNGKPGGCGCGGTPGTPPPLPGTPPTSCGIQVPPGPGPSVPIPVSQQIGAWNCQSVKFNLAPCDIARIEREEKLPTVEADLAGPIVAGVQIAVEFAPIDVSHSLCIDFIRVSISDGAVPPVVTTLDIPRIFLQGERAVQNPDGSYDQAWDFGDPERPVYLGITDGRCRCEWLCACVPAEGHARLLFDLPQAVGLGETLQVEVWGRRKDWLASCGPCPPCLICGQVPLTAEEEAATADRVYVVV